MQAIAPRVRFIGAEDDNLDLFEGQYPLNNGISYNSYLIDDDQIAVMDTVDILPVSAAHGAGSLRQHTRYARAISGNKSCGNRQSHDHARQLL